MRVMITGGAGFIGGHLTDAFVGRGDSVTVIDDLSTGDRANVNKGAVLHEGDVRDRTFVQRTFEQIMPEVVLHLAAQADVRRSMDDPLHDLNVNLVGTVHLLEAAKRCGTGRFVFASTGGAVYGEPVQMPVPETLETTPVCCYGASKRAAELYLGVYAESYGLRTTVLRFANVYGPRQNPKGEAGVVAIFSLQMLDGRQPTIFGDGSKTRDYVYVEDIVAAHVLAVENEIDGTFNLGTGRPTSDQQVFDAIRGALGVDMKPQYGSRRKGEIEHIALDPGRAAVQLGWSPKVDFEEGIRRSTAYYRQRFTK